MTQSPAGFDADSIGRWIEQRFGVSDFDVEVMSVGRSNLTFTIFVDGSPRWVLRRPPLGHEGGSAHNVAREGRIMAALNDSGVPVPTVLDIVDDPKALDVPFVFMDHCPGFPINTPAEWESVPAENRRDCAFGMVDALAAIHSVDVDAVGLSDLRRPGGLIDRQLRRWIGQVEKIAMRGTPIIHEVHDALRESMPDRHAHLWESRTGTSNRTICSSLPAGRSTPSSTGSSPPSARCSPTSAISSPCSRCRTGTRASGFPVPRTASDHRRTHRPLPGRHRPRSPRCRLLLGLCDVEARLHP